VNTSDTPRYKCKRAATAFLLEFLKDGVVCAAVRDRMALSGSQFCDKLAQGSGTITTVHKVFHGGLRTARFGKMEKTRTENDHGSHKIARNTSVL
jgi:hypothetical protein